MGHRYSWTLSGASFTHITSFLWMVSLDYHQSFGQLSILMLSKLASIPPNIDESNFFLSASSSRIFQPYRAFARSQLQKDQIDRVLLKYYWTFFLATRPSWSERERETDCNQLKMAFNLWGFNYALVKAFSSNLLMIGSILSLNLLCLLHPF